MYFEAKIVVMLPLLMEDVLFVEERYSYVKGSTEDSMAAQTIRSAVILILRRSY